MVTKSVAGLTSNRFFNDLGAKVKKIALIETEKMAESLLYALKHRQHLAGGNGQYPKWQGKKPSKKSFQGWVKTLQGKDKWVIQNVSTDPATEYNYPRALITGKGWSKKVRQAVIDGGGSTKNLTLVSGGKIFSKQLPNGLDPWLKIKRLELKRNIQKAIK